MAEWVIVFLAGGTVISYLMNRSALNPVTILLAVFTLVSFLANLHLYGLYQFPDIAYLIVFAGCASILAGAVMARLLHAASLRNPATVRRRRHTGWRISYGFLNWALVVTIVTIVATRWGSLSILASGGSLADVRNTYLGYNATGEYALSAGALLGRVVVSPVLFAALPIFVYSMVERQRNRWFNVLLLVAIALNLATSGGRIIFVYAVVQLLVLLALNGRLRVRMSRGRALALVLALVAVVTLVTLSRGNALLFEAYTYFAIPLPLLAHWTSVTDTQAIYTDGSSFFYGVVTLVANGVGIVGGSVAESTTEVVKQPQDTWVELLPGRPFNAFVTLFYYFYADFRIPGVVLFSAMYGAFVQTMYDRARASNGLLPKLLLLLTIQSVVMSFIRWQPTDGAYVLAFVVLLAAVRKTKAGDNGSTSESDSSRGLGGTRAASR